MQDIEPFFGWQEWYTHEMDPHSPFHEVDHNLFGYDRSVFNYLAHPQWDDFGSESLLVKILFADYDRGYAILELLGVWHDLFENDFKLLSENVLTFLSDAGIQKFIFIAENVIHAYLDADDYYQAMSEEIPEGWMCLLRLRPHVRDDFDQYQILPYFFRSATLDGLNWRKLKPWQLFDTVEGQISRILPE